MEIYFGKYKNYWRKEILEGATQVPTRHQGAPTPWLARVGSGAPSQPLMPIFWYISPFSLEKIRRGLSGRSVAVLRWNLGRSTFALWRRDSARDTSLREGEIEVVIITNNPLIVGGPIFINIFNSTISSQTLVHLLCSILLPEL